MPAFTNKDFQSFWPRGFLSEPDQGYSHEETVAVCITPFASPDRTCLEIGPGGGTWTPHLLQRFKETTAVDVVPMTPNLRERIAGLPPLRYIQAVTYKYDTTLDRVCDASVDFAFCNHVFCHLPQSMVRDYVKSVARVLVPGGQACLVSADWPRHPTLKAEPHPEQYAEFAHPLGWFFQDEAFFRDAVTKAGLQTVARLLPGARDCFLHVVK